MKGMRTILIVEDYDDVRGMMKVLLESENFHVLEAGSGSEALEVIKKQHPDAILMDLALPGFDGFETIHRIRAFDGFRNIPIIVLTAYTAASTYETALSAGSNYFMAKPVDFDDLLNLLKQVFSDGNARTLRQPRTASQRAIVKHRPLPPSRERELRYNA
jgi:CheY-like chemotaxis protein